MDALRRGASILKIDVLRGDLHIVQSGLDIAVAHQLHERRQADPARTISEAKISLNLCGLAIFTPVVRR